MIAQLLRAGLAAGLLGLSAAAVPAGELVSVRQAGGCVAVIGAAWEGAELALSLDVQRHPADCGCRSKMMAVTLEDAAGTIVGQGRFALEPAIGPRAVNMAIAPLEGGPAVRVSVGCAGE